MFIASFRDAAAANVLAARIGDGTVQPEPASLNGALLVWRGPGGWAAGPGALLAAQGDIVDRARARLLTLGEIAALLAEHGDAALTGWAPPFRLAWHTDAGVDAAADAPGLAHWFIWQGDGVAAVASSATLLARAFGLAPDTAALGGLALTGAMVGDASIIAGVRKLPAGQAARLADGQLTLRTLSPPRILAEPADALQAATARLLAVYPHAEVELSGGWDSRLMLAAMPMAARRGRTGFTIGRAGDADVTIAARLASASAMTHDIADPGGLAGLDAKGFAALLATTAARDDYAANPLDRAVINFVNAARPARPRFSGQNGEILRGFYYPGQPLGAVPSATLARRLIDWRIISNDRVDPALFDPAWLAATRAAVTGQLEGLLLGGGDADWAAALDRTYLEQRMQRWCGASVTAALGLRPVLLPFFDADVLALARTTPAAAKAGSRFAAAAIARLDPVLAAIALESGLTPAAVAAGGAINRLALARRFAGKAVAKARQRLLGQDRATFGSATTLGLAADHGLLAAVDIHRLAGLGIFAPAALDAFAVGRPTRASAGFVLNCHYLLERLAAGAPS